jgi:hypothetical protein
MKLHEVLDRARATLNDTALPYRWSDTELVDYLNDSINELCAVTKYIIDSTSDMCLITTYDGINSYPIDDRIISIKRASDPNYDLEVTTAAKIVSMCGKGFMTAKGQPRRMWVEGGNASFYPIPDDTYEISLVVCRRPLEQMDAGYPESIPEINAVYHTKLIYGIGRYAYMKDQQETVNPVLAQTYAQLWQRAMETILLDMSRLNNPASAMGYDYSRQ